MSGTKKNIASLWIGGRLSWLEQLCLKSFADAGHRTTLYSYEPIDNVPEGVETADARSVYDPETVLRHTRTGSPAIHADVWRLHLMQKTDEVWVDADVYCHRPFDQSTDHVFGYEKPGLVCNAVLRLPENSPALAELLAFFDDEARADKTALGDMKWGATGPGALTKALENTGEISHAAPKAAYYPVSFPDRNKMLLSRFKINDWLTEDTRAVHFWARRLKPRLAEKMNNQPRRGSYLHGLLKKHDISTNAAPIPGWRPRGDDTSTPLPALKVLGDALNLRVPAQVVDIGPGPAPTAPYAPLWMSEQCEITGFDAQDTVTKELQKSARESDSYDTKVIANGQPATLHTLKEPALTSLFAPHDSAIRYLGRSEGNIRIQSEEAVDTHKLDDLVDHADLIKIDARGAENTILQNATRLLQKAVVVIPRVRFYRLYLDEPLFGDIDRTMRAAGFTLHKLSPATTKVIPNSEIDHLNRSANRNQWIEGDAIYIRDPARIPEFTHNQLRHLALIATGAINSFDLALLAIDTLTNRGLVPDTLAGRFAAALPEKARKERG